MENRNVVLRSESSKYRKVGYKEKVLWLRFKRLVWGVQRNSTVGKVFASHMTELSSILCLTWSPEPNQE